MVLLFKSFNRKSRLNDFLPSGKLSPRDEVFSMGLDAEVEKKDARFIVIRLEEENEIYTRRLNTFCL